MNLRFIHINNIAYSLIVALMAGSCSDALVEEQERPTIPSDDKGIGQMVLFSSGTTENTETRAGRTYYMPDGYRFICRMYYKASSSTSSSADLFDISGGTDQTAWLKVDGNVGNSLYWNKEYTSVGTNKGEGGVDDYGNDYAAHAFYWQNRKEHAFLAWTDLNRAKSINGKDSPGNLRFNYYTTYEEHTGDEESKWTTTGSGIVGYNTEIKKTLDDIIDVAVKNYAEVQTAQASALEGFTYDPSYKGHRMSANIYSCSSFPNKSESNQLYDTNDNMIAYDYGPYLYFVWNDSHRTEYQLKAGEGVDDSYVLYNGMKYVRNSDREIVAIFDPKYPDKYWKKDPDYYSQIWYDTSGDPDYMILLFDHLEKKKTEIVNTYKVNSFDLRRPTGENKTIADQPDPVLALTIQKPDKGTQEGNRVNLCFKHQFSQIQVNLKSSGDNSVSLNAGDIEKVELLGVTETGYIATELNERDSVMPAKYAEIDFSKYDADQLKNNPYGTSFEMFPMPEEQTEFSYLKSFNAIAFGQLQAIRITWHETGSTSVTHASTFRIPNTELVNLQSGVKYVWNIEIRRGTLAIIRTEIVDWELPTDEAHNGSTDGIIYN